MKRRETLIAAGVGALAVLLMLVGLIRPKASAVTAKQKEVEQAVGQQRTLELRLQQLQAAAKDAPKDRKKLAALRSKVPPTADLPGLIRLLNKAADQSDVSFMTIAPGQPAPSTDGQISVIPIQITVSGQFFSVDQYLYELETLSRLSSVQSVNVTGGTDQTSSTLSANITANFFTTDLSAGPGSNPAPGGSVGSQPATPTPTPTSTPPLGG